MMKSETLTELLIALEEARNEFFFRSVNEEPQLFSSFFDFEKSESLLCLSFEREYSLFVTNNLEKISRSNLLIKDPHIYNKIKEIIEEFVCFHGDKNNSNNIDVQNVLLSEKINNIDNLFSICSKDKDRIEQINYIRKRENVLFDREFKRLLKEQNDIEIL